MKSIGSSEQLNSVQVTKQHESGGIYHEALCVSKLYFSTGTAPLREDLLTELRRMRLVSSFVMNPVLHIVEKLEAMYSLYRSIVGRITLKCVNMKSGKTLNAMVVVHCK